MGELNFSVPLALFVMMCFLLGKFNSLEKLLRGMTEEKSRKKMQESFAPNNLRTHPMRKGPPSAMKDVIP